MYIKLSGILTNKIQEITLNDYEMKYCSIPAENVESLIEDLVNEIERQEEKYKELERELQDNYEPISLSKMYDIDEKDFY